MTTTVRPTPSDPGHERSGPRTLSIDVDGNRLEAWVLSADGAALVDRVRADTPHPCPPERLLARLTALVASFPHYDRVSVGFPGVVRAGRVLSAPDLAAAPGSGGRPRKKQAAAWRGFDLAAGLQAALGRPTKVVHASDLRGAAVIRGEGLELVLTLGARLGSSLFEDGRLCPHLELAHHPFRKGETYGEQLGDAARRRVGDPKWNRRVQRAVETLDGLLSFDVLHLGGGNARRVTVDLGPKVTRSETPAVGLGGVLIWEGPDTLLSPGRPWWASPLSGKRE
jgi:polyphosphate glucokinase